MTWRRWHWGDVKEDVREVHQSDLPITGLPSEPCSICEANLDLVPESSELPRVIRRGSKTVHVRAPNQPRERLKRTRCGRYYIIEKEST